eukprot:2582442-Pleurochrysis_carterae.AAC.4
MTDTHCGSIGAPIGKPLSAPDLLLASAHFIYVVVCACPLNAQSSPVFLDPVETQGLRFMSWVDREVLDIWTLRRSSLS